LLPALFSGVCYIPLKNLHNNVENWFHTKTRRNGEVKGFMRLKLDILKDDRQVRKGSAKNDKELLSLLKTKALLDRQVGLDGGVEVE
jgi:hypothetical protein